jgi:hypothetical protein
VSIGKRVGEAIVSLAKGDSENALFQICAAVEPTAQGQGYGKGGKGFKAWIDSQMPLIASVAFGPALAGVRIAYSHPRLKQTPDGAHDVSAIVYHVIRCGLYHEGKFADSVRITDSQVGSGAQGELLINKGMIVGLVLAVVGSSSNAGEMTAGNHYIETQGKRFQVNDYWGQGDRLLQEISVLRASQV